MRVIERTEEFQELLEGDALLVVDWYANWCGPCKMIAPMMEEIAEEYRDKNVVFVKIDVDQLPDLSAEYGITAMPTIHLFRGKSRVSEIVGANVSAIKAEIAKHAQ